MGFETLQAATGKPHGVHEAYVGDRDGNVWVADVPSGQAGRGRRPGDVRSTVPGGRGGDTGGRGSRAGGVDGQTLARPWILAADSAHRFDPLPEP